MKVFYRILVISIFLMAAGAIFISASGSHGRDLDEIINEIFLEQNAGSLSEITPAKVSPELLEELGDAVMGIMIADDEHHEWMDAMLGGEGSEQLSSAHRDLGYQYIINDGNLSSVHYGGRGWMMGGIGMMGIGFNRFPNGFMNSSWGWHTADWIIGIVIGVILLTILVILILRFRSPQNSSEALLVLKTRFANGEISENEYEKMKKILQ
ncbi:MAG: SHOCT domain-containing protein [Spirochaetales bacterium]|nr:SHOCT domain-containing protein [Spirochaetales bacterium]